MENKGKVISVKGHIIEVEFESNPPSMHDVVFLEKDPNVKMEVYDSSSSSTFYCISLSSSKKLHRGAVVINSGEPIKIPVGNEVLGRVIDIFARPQDGKEDLVGLDVRPIFAEDVNFESVLVPSEVLEIGIKAFSFNQSQNYLIDLFRSRFSICLFHHAPNDEIQSFHFSFFIILNRLRIFCNCLFAVPL